MNDTQRATRARYMRHYRRTNPEVRERGRLQVAAYEAAEHRIREAHRAEFDRYYTEEKQNRGLA